MSKSFKEYRKVARTATRELLILKPKETVKEFISRINASKTEAEVSRILRDVREVM